MSFIGFLIYCAVIIPPFWMLLPRWGLTPWLSLLAVSGIGVAGLLWYMALKPGGGAAGPGGAR